jgi:hypothetical protein
MIVDQTCLESTLSKSYINNGTPPDVTEEAGLVRDKERIWQICPNNKVQVNKVVSESRQNLGSHR